MSNDVCKRAQQALRELSLTWPGDRCIEERANDGAPILVIDAEFDRASIELDIEDKMNEIETGDWEFSSLYFFNDESAPVRTTEDLTLVFRKSPEPMGLTLWRLDGPRIRETMAAQYGGRDTGTYGTGLFGMRSKETATKAVEGKHYTDLYELPNIMKSSFEPGTISFPSVSDIGKAMIKKARWPSLEKEKEWAEQEVRQEWEEIFDQWRKEGKTEEDINDYERNVEKGIRERFRDIDRRRRQVDLEIEVNKHWMPNASTADIDNAVEKTRKCMEENENNVCSQPMNHLLLGLGFDSVCPKGRFGNSTREGCVVLKETLEKCLEEEPLQEYQDLNYISLLDKCCTKE